jgi:hypothetical protein
MGILELPTTSSPEPHSVKITEPAFYATLTDPDFRDYMSEFARECIQYDDAQLKTLPAASATIYEYLKDEAGITKARTTRFVRNSVSLGIVNTVPMQQGKLEIPAIDGFGMTALGVLLWFDPINAPFRQGEVRELKTAVRDLIGNHPITAGFRFLQEERYNVTVAPAVPIFTNSSDVGYTDPSSSVLTEAFPILSEPERSSSVGSSRNTSTGQRKKPSVTETRTSDSRVEYSNAVAAFDPKALRSSRLAATLRARRQKEAEDAWYLSKGIDPNEL